MEMKENKTKKLKTLAGFGLSLLLTLFSACTTPTDSSTGSEDAPITVILISNSAFTAQADTATFQRGEDVQFTITMHEGFEFVGCNYDNFDFSIEGNVVYITLYDVLYPFRLQIQSKDIRIPEEELKRQYQIHYHLNGGTTSDGSTDFRVNSTLKNHDRANVSIGEGLERSGYTLYGWNTKADGSGEHIGLGSRVTIPESRVVELYAEWMKWASNELFEYEEGAKGLTLTKYLGDTFVENLVIPNEIDGKPVVQLATGFAKDISADELVLSQNLYGIEEQAFVDCSFDTITLYDNIMEISDESFAGQPVKTLQINAARKPAYLAVSDFAQFADNIDRLMLSKGEKKLIFFAGCSMAYGLRSDMVAWEFKEYKIFNLGILGGVDAGIQFDCIVRYLEEGDVFVHAPEQGSPYQFMAERKFDTRVYSMLEGNYDLLRFTDLTLVEDVFDAFAEYNRSRALMMETDYEADKNVYNEYGDYIVGRIEQRLDKDLPPDDYTFLVELLTDETMATLCAQYDRISEKGVQIYFSFAPINYHGLPQADIDAKVWEAFQQRCEEVLNPKGYLVISDAYDYIFRGAYFYDADYHLSDMGAKLRTEKLIEDLKKVLTEE